MRKPEQRLWDAMRKNNKKQLHTINLERVENYITAGMPDVHCKYHGVECWVELKVASLPKKEGTRVMGRKGLRIEQINWHKKHHSFGLKSYILLKTGNRLFLIANKHTESVNQMCLFDLEQTTIATDWESIFILLRHPK